MANPAVDREIIAVSLPADAALGTAMLIVAVNGDGQIAYGAGSVDAVIGVLQNKTAAADEPARVAIAGVSRCIAGAAVNAGELIKSNAQGFGLPTTTTGNTYAGRALTDAVGSGNIFELLIQPGVI